MKTWILAIALIGVLLVTGCVGDEPELPELNPKAELCELSQYCLREYSRSDDGLLVIFKLDHRMHNPAPYGKDCLGQQTLEHGLYIYNHCQLSDNFTEEDCLARIDVPFCKWG